MPVKNLNTLLQVVLDQGQPLERVLPGNSPGAYRRQLEDAAHAAGE
jgi:hypothetical protein